MIRRPQEVFNHPYLLNEYRRLAALPKFPIDFDTSYDPNEVEFACRSNVFSPIFAICKNGVDFAGCIPLIQWFKEGPKIVDITEEQYQALSQVEVRLEVKDFRMPYPTVLVNLPPGLMHEMLIIHHMELQWHSGKKGVVIGDSMTRDHQNDIVTVIRQQNGVDMEVSLSKYDEGITTEEGDAAHLNMRVAVNMMLAMVNYSCQAEYLFPAEVAMEKKFIEKGNRPSREGRTASQRLAEQPMVVLLDRTVKLYHRVGSKEPGEKTGGEKCFHWRRGHWRKRPDREKLIFVRPCMVRADKLLVDKSETTTTYNKGGTK